MGLKIPNLDKNDFQKMMEESLAKLPAYSKRWTDYNASDPGITIIELLAWMADINSYRLNRLGEEHYFAFLELLGEELREKKSGFSDEIIEFPLGESNGYAKQSLEIPRNVVIDSIVLRLNDDEWQQSDELFSALPNDKVYSIHHGYIVFGDGAYGQIPTQGEAIVLHAKAYHEKGRVLESLDEAFMRLKRDENVSCRAVTLEDYEYIALQIPSLNLARVKASITKDKTNSVSIMLIPHSQEKEPQVDKKTLKTVRRFLYQKKLLTTRIEMVNKVNYLSVDVTLSVKTRYGDPLILKEDIRKRLEAFLHPLYGGKEGRGWMFGEDVHISHIYMLLNQVEEIEKIDYIYFSSKQQSEDENSNANKSAYFVSTQQIKISIEKNKLPISGRHHIYVQSIKELGDCP